MAFAPGYDLAEAQVMMTLAALAYANENPLPAETLAHHQDRIRTKIVQELATPGYATQGNWTWAWGPGLTASNMMYVARKTGADHYAVAIRGTDWHFLFDWIEDFDVLKLVPFPYITSQDPNIRIAQGMMDGLNELIGMSGSATADAQGPGTPINLLQFLLQAAMSAEGDIDVFVTGHSLGGGLASVLASWLAFQTAQWTHLNGAVNIKVYTFAAPTAGNASFATHGATFFGDRDWRVFNSLDVVPNAWQTLEVIKTYYTPQPTCPVWARVLLDGAIEVGKAAQLDFTQPGNPHSLPGSVSLPNGADFELQVGYQHSGNTYLTLLGAAPIDQQAHLSAGGASSTPPAT